MQCIRMNQIKLPLGHSREELEEKIQKRLGIKREALEHYEIIRQSIDFPVYCVRTALLGKHGKTDSWSGIVHQAE